LITPFGFQRVVVVTEFGKGEEDALDYGLYYKLSINICPILSQIKDL
jgi:hypothetical protein